MIEVVLLGGPFKGRRVTLTKVPPRIDVGHERYERIDDPDSGQFLGGYAYVAPGEAVTEAQGGAE